MAPELDPHTRHWTARDERVSLILASVSTWALVALIVAIAPRTTQDVAAVVIGFPVALVSWHLAVTVERRRANAAIRYARTVRAVEHREHRGLLDRDRAALAYRRRAEAQLDADRAKLKRNPLGKIDGSAS